MPGAELAYLAAQASSALIASATTDTWIQFRARVAQLLGRRDTDRERLELERLDRTADALRAVDLGTADREVEEARHIWQARLELLLEDQDPADRAHTVTELRALLDDLGSGTRVHQPAVVNTGRVVHSGVIVGDHHRIAAPSRAWSDEEQGDTGPSFAITGDAAIVQVSNVFIATPRGHTRPAWPHQIGPLPRRADAFRRTSTVGALEAAAGSSGTVVLVGPAGVGKTQAAADLVARVRQDGGADLLVWITAGSRAAVVAGYAHAAAEILGDQDPDAELAAQRFLAWLSNQPAGGVGRCRWMVVLDDVADPADLRGLWPPDHDQGRVLVTTRRRDASLHGGGNKVVPVGLFTEGESLAYLTERLAVHERHEDTAELRALAAELDHLPLALSQAAAYLVDAGVDCAYYRRRLADRATSLADLTPDPGMLPDDQTTTLAAAWSLSVESANQMRPLGLARPMLRLLSLLDPNGVPAPVLTGLPTLRFLAAQRNTGTPRQEEPDPPTADEAALALRALHRFSLIDHDPAQADQAVRVLETVQRTTRDSLTPDERDAAAVAAADALLAAWPPVARDSALAQALRANVSALTRHALSSLFEGGRAHPVLFRAGESLGASGQVAAALDHFRQLAEAGERFLSPDHPDTLVARSRTAFWLGESGQIQNALQAYREVLERLRETLGPDSPGTLTARAELAWWQGHAGDVAGAVSATSDLLGDLIRVLGPDHPSTLTTRHNLAWWRGKAGDIAGAATTTAELLGDFVRVLGPDHPATLTARHSLAQWRGESGDAPGAAAAYEELLDLMRGVLGPDHPATLAGRHDLAWWRGQAGDSAGAAAAYEQVLDDRLRALGPDHPDTLATRADLAWWRGQAGDSAGAAAAYEQVLHDRMRVLGPDHPDTLATRADLAYWQAMVGQTAERGGEPGEAGPGAPGCRVGLTLLDDGSPGVDRPIRIALRLHADPGHPWAVPDSRRRPVLEVVATALGAATVEPARALYDHVHDMEFILLARRAGRHVIRFTLYEHASGTALQQVETELTVTGVGQDAEALVPAPERRRRR
ncbi:tetratricopeptide repeat protein [Streptomyces sp. NPDC050448]|uniref:tetratricopeptide repeat protein n=1 Tax=Streptomyces sp. NPDC050448 TaxID=3155404 RepID=UPI0034487F4E